MTTRLHTLILLLMAVTYSCGTPSPNVTTATANSLRIDDRASGQDLTYYLGRIAGVRVQGTGSGATIQIRGQSSFTEDSRPLFVVDGAKVGHEYASVYAMVNPTNVARITVLKNGEENSLYGLQGANGVIVIETKD